MTFRRPGSDSEVAEMQALVLLYCLVLLLLCIYGAHRAHLVWLLIKHSRQIELASRLCQPDERAPLPRVTVQLPLYNEATVVERLLSAVARLDYPRELLDIQVLDDSSDETTQLGRAKVEELSRQGFDVRHVRRASRDGYKAGALDYGLGSAKGELIAVFDADFVPERDFLTSLAGHFRDPGIGMVQARWSHLNRDESYMTRVLALMLDGHHYVENRARFGAGLLFNFSGTGGIWRKSAILDAGGWQHDTVTEDLDLSYRAQLRGWRFIYRADVAVPAELPSEMSALRAQQYRWAKGTVQTARKLLPAIQHSRLSAGQRVEAAFHLTPHFAYPLTMALTLLLLPTLWFLPATDLKTMLLIDLPLCLGATGSIASFYVAAGHAAGRRTLDVFKELPGLIALGAGLGPHLTRAVFAGLTQSAGEFVRTPKRGSAPTRYRQASSLPLGELLLGLLSLTSFVVALQTRHWFAAPFALLFACGYGYVAACLGAEQLGAQAHASGEPVQAREPVPAE
jgi:cellulose synthase/poly-beta-1,6-N-acetylglucosamine synthase-like glycosyltransferase